MSTPRMALELLTAALSVATAVKTTTVPSLSAHPGRKLKFFAGQESGIVGKMHWKKHISLCMGGKMIDLRGYR